MNIGGLAMQAFGGAVKELDGKGKEDVRAVFRQESAIFVCYFFNRLN